MGELEDIVRGALYTEVRELSDGKSIVMDPETEHMYYRKELSVYSVPVFRFLKEHNHRNLPVIHLFWQEEGKLIVIEELIQGRTLDQLLDKNELSFEEKKRILLEICDGLQYLHSARPPVIHRDIKAANIMVTEDGTVKIIDYDAAKQNIGEKSRDTVLIGTQGIAAPEQYGFGQSDERTDIFALGKLIERMLPDSKHAMEIVNKATRLEPDRRYGSVKEIREKIGHLWDPSIPDSVHRKEKIRSGLKSKWFRRVVAGLAAAVLITGGAVFFKEKIYPKHFVQNPAYEKGLELMEGGEYEEAIKQFEICGQEYQDTKDQVIKCKRELNKKQHQSEAEALVQKWRNSPNNAYMKDSILACITVLNDGNGDMLSGYCQELLRSVKDMMKAGKKEQAVSIMVSMSEIMKAKGGEIETIRKDTVDSFVAYANELQEYDSVAKFYMGLGEKGGDYTEEINSSNYRQGIKLMENGYYDAACDLFLTILDYKDAGAQRKKCYYLSGKELMKNGKYAEAARQFGFSDGYEDAKQLENNCKYEYCREHVNSPDDTTHRYLDDLRKAGYAGIEDLGSRVESWKVDFEVTEVSSNEVDILLTFTGGPAEGMKGYKAVCLQKEGNSMTHTGRGLIRSGSTDSLRYTHNGTRSAFSNIAGIRIYDTDGNLIGSYSK